jgi:hypothetical protein
MFIQGSACSILMLTDSFVRLIVKFRVWLEAARMLALVFGHFSMLFFSYSGVEGQRSLSLVIVRCSYSFFHHCREFCVPAQQ